MEHEKRIAAAGEILLAFADRTGVTDPRNLPRRYLWTDAHAVCTLLGLHLATSGERYRDVALVLIAQVHDVLGRHRDDDPRSGWISGLGEAEGRAHPTAGGLRIGKPLRERRPSERADDRTEWDRDGQYFHYLTKWMHALCRACAVTGEADYGRWAAELADAAVAGFIAAGPGGERLYWKMSIDLSYPLVASSGHHDPLDGFITCREIEHVAGQWPGDAPRRLAAMIGGRDWTTMDPLGIGGLLFDAGRVIGLTAAGRTEDARLGSTLVGAAATSLESYTAVADLGLAAEYRLAFRELGLSIGLRGIDGMLATAERHAGRFEPGMRSRLQGLRRFIPHADSIESFWSDPASQAARSWQDHLDINAVTLATSLAPDGFLAV